MSLEDEHEAVKLVATQRCFCLFAILLMLAPSPVPAAETLNFRTAYLSDAMSVTEAMVKACTSRHPELAARGTAALESWRQRNAADARRAARLVAEELKNLPASKEETERALAQLKQEHLEGWHRVAAFPTACSDYVASLESPESDLARLLPRS
jgi:hypothetical protein